VVKDKVAYIFELRSWPKKGAKKIFDGLVKSQKPSVFVIPANAGIRDNEVSMDPRSPIGVEDKLRGGDGLGDFLRDHQFSLSHKIYRTLRSTCLLLIPRLSS